MLLRGSERIRTSETFHQRLPVFKTGAIIRSATLPNGAIEWSRTILMGFADPHLAARSRLRILLPWS